MLGHEICPPNLGNLLRYRVDPNCERLQMPKREVTLVLSVEPLHPPAGGHNEPQATDGYDVGYPTVFLASKSVRKRCATIKKSASGKSE